jgi:sulfhydrogenase subunit beta (sulfur reductase)
MHYLIIDKDNWEESLEKLLESHSVFASVENEFGQDYELIRAQDIPSIIYNKPKPATPLKNFFLPVKENVTSDRINEKPRIILGVPNCDIEALSLLDEIYLDTQFNDILYRNRRENTLIISSDCFGIQDHCHCMSYNIKPWSSAKADLAVLGIDGKIILRIISRKGEEFSTLITSAQPLDDDKIISLIEKEHHSTESKLAATNKGLPDYQTTGKLVSDAGDEIWKKFSSSCVSCGACTTICPTCTCFLLIDKPGFEKVKQVDACQYPGFERVAGGEDALFKLHNRFRNRYMCKYVWKPEKFKSVACTGCGRCIEACIGKINKNEIFMELVK